MDSFISLFGPSADEGEVYHTDDDDGGGGGDIDLDTYTISDALNNSTARQTSSSSNTSSTSTTSSNYGKSHHATNHQRISSAANNDNGNSTNGGSGSNSSSGSSSAAQPLLQSAALLNGRLPPEPQLGNVEYKLQLLDPTAQRFEHLVTQMKWRLREGNGEAIYEIGVADSGHLHGLPDAEMVESLQTLRRMANQLGATTTVLRRQRVPASSTTISADNTSQSSTTTAQQQPAQQPSRTVAEVLVRKVPDDQPGIEVRCAVLGSAGAGKSTLLGVLTQGERDNGRGRARLNMFRHMHEIRSGRTSCISHETLGFDSGGAVLNYAANCDAEQLSERASKLVSFMDLAGHRRYMRTTVQALTGYGPHQAMLVIGSTPPNDINDNVAPTSSDSATTTTPPNDIRGMAGEHLDIVLALSLPFFIVITKIDAAAPDTTLVALQRMLTAAGCRRVPLPVRSVDDVLTAATQQLGGQVVPIFCVSCVTGAGLELLQRFLYVLPPGVSAPERERLESEPAEFRIDEVFRVPDAGGPVVGGLMVQGVLAQGERMRLGPQAPDGGFVAVRVRGMHRNKAPCRAVRAGQSASLLIVGEDGGDVDLTVRSGMVLLPSAVDECESGEVEPCGSLFFQAKISVLFHATAICEGFQTTVHCGSIRQTAVIEGIMGARHIGTNDTASVLFRFVCHPEYVQPGQRLLFREGTSKGVGHVTQVFPLNRMDEMT